MKIDNRYIDQLLSVIPDNPNQRIMHFGEECSGLVEKTAHLCADREYEYQIQCLNEEFANHAIEEYPQPNIKIKQISLSQPRYHIQAKMYDFVFVETEVEDKTHFLKTLYRAMKNAANIFVLYPKGKMTQEEEWRTIMEENYYVAFSAFDLNDEVRVISAKKMHGWGG